MNNVLASILSLDNRTSISTPNEMLALFIEYPLASNLGNHSGI